MHFALFRGNWFNERNCWRPTAFAFRQQEPQRFQRLLAKFVGFSALDDGPEFLRGHRTKGFAKGSQAFRGHKISPLGEEFQREVFMLFAVRITTSELVTQVRK